MDYAETPKKIPYNMIVIMFIGAFVALLANTLLNVALPTIMKEFDVTPGVVQWLTTGYMLINGILIPASAFFVQKFSNRRLFITAMTLFTIGTALAGFAPTFSMLVAARMVQAAGSSMMMPLLMNVMLAVFPIEKRGAAMGIFGLAMITAPAIGPTLSGWVLEHYEWRMLFYIMLPFAILTLLFAIVRLKSVMKTRDELKLDLLSLVLSSIGFGGLLYGFSFAGEKGWDSPHVYGAIAAGAIGLVLFIWRQLVMKDPMLEFRIYKFPMFALGSAVSVVMSVAMFSAMILTPLYVQTIRGISPFHSGLLMLPGALIMGFMSPITGKLFDRYGPKLLAIVGLSILVGTTYFMSKFELDTGYYHIMMLYTLRMFGMSMVMMPIMTNGLNQLPMQLNPHGTAMNNTLQQVSGAIGSALLVTFMNSRTKEKATELAGAAKEKAQAAAEAAMKAGHKPQMPSPEALAQMKVDIAHRALLDGITHSFLITTAVAALALFLSLFIKRVVPHKYEGALAEEEAIASDMRP